MQQKVASFSSNDRDKFMIKLNQGKLMKLFKLVLLFLLSLMSLSLIANERCDLSFPKSNTCVNFEWVYGPYLDQYNTIKISYRETLDATSIKVIPWMVMQHGHEHGSRPVTMTQTGDREFLVDKIFFMGGMMGEWYLRVQLLDSKNSILEEQRQLIKF